jgi:peptidoglycan/xylan/chitin deacetylase (PgdA/CDA1 family)
MIGVMADPSQHEAVQEFFELFKTPWEFCQAGRSYDVLVCANSAAVHSSEAKLMVIYGNQSLAWDAEHNVQVYPGERSAILETPEGKTIPIYRGTATFPVEGVAVLKELQSREPAAYLVTNAQGRTVVRVGYNIFEEIIALLAEGQPACNAGMQTLDLHIAFLRNLLVSSGIQFVEIPPVPNGYRFVACLTHDMDHPSIRRHFCDRTMWGFLYRATVGSLVSSLSGRITLSTLLSNWVAVLKLPFVYLGVADDFWSKLRTYTALDGGAHSTFFVIPFRAHPGIRAGMLAPRARKSGYGAADVAELLGQLEAQGHEIGLHGIDAWHDSRKGRSELEEVARYVAASPTGARMHWLYFDEHSPEALESAGVEYDSTVGYNDAVGYRAGTSQVYKPLNAVRLLELPLHIMDTAMFSPKRQNLTFSEAKKRVGEIIENAVRNGGVITVNWHDRSIASERLWRDFYSELVEQLRSNGAWFASATDAVRWFRKRRSVRLKHLTTQGEINKLTYGMDLPGLCLRVQNADVPSQVEDAPVGAKLHDCGFEGTK